MLEQKEYEFLKQYNIQLLCYGGSLSYGTNLPNKGDVDIRGFLLENPTNLLLGKPLPKVYEDKNTDTVLYGFNRYVDLLANCNPNVIEQLGCKPEHYFIKTELGQELIDNRHKFLSKKAVRSFAGYANSQLSRMENALARGGVSEDRKAVQLKRTLDHMLLNFNDRYDISEYGSIEFAQKDDQLFANMKLEHIPLGKINPILSEFKNTIGTFESLSHRNRKKDEEHLDKHAMHLIRLFLMAIDILENGEIVTYREKEREELLAIRQGKYRNKDGTYQPEFFEYVEELEQKVKSLEVTTMLPDQPDYEWIDKLLIRVNKEHICNGGKIYEC